jgi:hypothetical protein
MKTPLLQSSWLDRIVVCPMVIFLPQGISWTFADIASWYCGVLLCLYLALTCRRKSTFGIGCVAAIVCLIIAIVNTLQVQPLRTAITGSRFEAVPLTNVLQYLATQKQDRPEWWFLIYEKDLASTKITLDLPKSCTLSCALDRIAQSAKCEFSYTWFKSCGNAGRPSCARFMVRKQGSKSTDSRRQYALIDRRGIVQFSGQ